MRNLQKWFKSDLDCLKSLLEALFGHKIVAASCYLNLTRNGSQQTQTRLQYLLLRRQGLWRARIWSCPSRLWKFPCCRRCLLCRSERGTTPGSPAGTSCSPPVAAKGTKHDLWPLAKPPSRAAAGEGSYLVLGFQRLGVNHADVVGFGSGVIIISIFNKVAGAVVCEVRHCVVEKGNGPAGEDISHKTTWGEGKGAGREICCKHRYYSRLFGDWLKTSSSK